MIVVAGEVLVDLVLQADGRVDARLGGGPYNTARTLARLGAATTFFGGLGDDGFGRLLRDALRAEGVAIGVPGPSAAPTTLALVDLDQAGVASYRFYLTGTAAADLDYPALAAGYAETTARALAAAGGGARGVRAVHVGALGLVMEPIAAATERLLLTDVRPDALVMLDPNCRAGAIADRAAYLARIGRITARADVVKASVEDLAYLYPGSPAAEAAGLLLAAGPALVLVTDGPRPARAFLPGRPGAPGGPLTADVPVVPVADTIGAGDAFGGGFLAWWTANGLGRDDLRRPDLVGAGLRSAAAVAALTCARPGADPPRLADVQARNWWGRP